MRSFPQPPSPQSVSYEPKTTDPAQSAPHQLLTFGLGTSRFALRVEVVREVVRAVAIAVLPKAPPIVEGIINFRGTLIPVLDIRRRFELSAAPLAPEQHLIIATAGDRLVAVRVDRALDLMAVEAEAIESASHMAPGAEYVAGVARLPDGLLVIHDLERFLSLEEAEQVDAAVKGKQ